MGSKVRILPSRPIESTLLTLSCVNDHTVYDSNVSFSAATRLKFCPVNSHKTHSDGTQSIYAVFFNAERDKKRKGRVILRIQSGYVLDKGLTKRQKVAKKVSFVVLVKAAYEGRKLNP